MDSKEKEKLLKEMKEKLSDKEILESIKLENSIEDRYKMIETMAFQKGFEQGVNKIKQGIEQTTIKTIKAMLDNNSSYEFISKITGKSIAEIENIKNNN